MFFLLNESGYYLTNNPITFRDLIAGGASFTIKSNFQHFDDDDDDDDKIFSQLLPAVEDKDDDFVSPWNKSFAELIPSMQNIGHGIFKKMVKRPIDDEEIQGRCRLTIAYNAYMEKASLAFDSTSMRNKHKSVSKFEFNFLTPLKTKSEIIFRL